MKQTVTALKALYVALGGSAATVAALTLIPDLITAIATLVASSGGILPAVDSGDNGKVLKVADGAWGIGTDNTGT